MDINVQVQAVLTHGSYGLWNAHEYGPSKSWTIALGRTQSIALDLMPEWHSSHVFSPLDTSWPSYNGAVLNSEITNEEAQKCKKKNVVLCRLLKECCL